MAITQAIVGTATDFLTDWRRHNSLTPRHRRSRHRNNKRHVRARRDDCEPQT
jgi:hypothetical protein